MNELLESVTIVGAELGLSGSASLTGAGWQPNASDTIVAAQISTPGGAYEVAVIGDEKLITNLGGSDEGLNKIAAWLESRGAVIAGSLGGSLSEEANLGVSLPYLEGASISGDAGTFSMILAGTAPTAIVEAVRTAAPVIAQSAGIGLLNDVPLVVTAELGRTSMYVRDLLNLAPGTVVELDRLAGAPIDILVNGKIIARGEVVVVDEEFGVRVVEIVDADAN